MLGIKLKVFIPQALAASASLSFSLLAPSIAAEAIKLPREWKGTATVTAYGVHTQMHPKHRVNAPSDQASNGWNNYVEARTLRVVNQVGRHVELLLISPRGNQAPMLGTLSADSRELQIVDGIRSFSLYISGKNLSGCGVARGSDGNFQHYLNTYSASCWDLVAVP